VYVCPGVHVSTRCTLRKSRLASPLNLASAEDCTTLPLSVAALSRAMLYAMPMKALPAALDFAADSPDPVITSSPDAGHTTGSR
jgi:hypothetical protein